MNDTNHRRVLSAALYVALGAGAAQAADITVTLGAVDDTENGNCSLVEAVEAANTDSAVDGCTAGSGPDTIILPGGTFAFDGVSPAPFSTSGDNALPSVTSEITIEGNAATIERAAVLPFRLIHIAAGGALTLEEVTVRGGEQPVNGGGIHNSGTLNIVASTVTGNTAGEEGGGIWNAATGTLTIAGTTISGNTANAANAADAQGGGGVFNNGGSVQISNGTITDNVVEGDLGPVDGGGGVFNDGRNTPGATVTIANSSISGNTVTDTDTVSFGMGGRGGGILSIGSDVNDTIATLEVTGGEISLNEATQAGGGVETNHSITTLRDVTLGTNSTGVNGGGLHVQAGVPGEPGAVAIDGGEITGNIAVQEGGGVWNAAFATMTITGTTISGNTANAANAAGDAEGGGGVFNNGGSLRISDATITDNLVDGDDLSADDGGGGVFNDGRISPGTVTITDSTISGNTVTGIGSGGRGGGILNVGDADMAATLEVTGGEISVNQAAQAGGGIGTNNGVVTLRDVALNANSTGVNGGGVHVGGADAVVIDGGEITGNTAAQEGGGVWNAAFATMTIMGTTISGNTANAANAAGDAEGGGGVFNNGGSVRISNASITDNRVNGSLGTDDGGGGVFNDSRNTPGTVTIANSTISGNSTGATGHGGGLVSIGADGTTSLVNSTVSTNSAISGGGIDVKDGSLIVSFSTIHNNSASAGGGVDIDAGTVAVDNTIVAGNAPDNVAGTFQDNGSNLIDGDPVLGPLTSNGGPTRTHALLEGSPAIDGADATLCGNTSSGGGAVDQRGLPRPDGLLAGEPGVDGSCDIGAFEVVDAGFDLGDAPADSLAGYPTLLADNGALHLAGIEGPGLGVLIDSEPDGQPTADAEGDDTTGTDDEDGVFFITDPLRVGGEATVQVEVTAGPGILNAWIDFNGDGDWNDGGEQIFVDETLANGSNPGLMFDVPADAVSGETFARFRLDSAGGLTPDGVAADGEVEDYLIVLTGIPVETDLSVAVGDAPDPVTVGDNVTYSVTLTNNGPASATDVVVGAALPSGTSFVSAEIGGTQCTESAGEVDCALGELAVDGSREAVVVARAEQAGSLTFTVTVTAAEADPAPANNTASETTMAGAGGSGSGGGGGGSDGGGGGGPTDPWLLGLLGVALVASRWFVRPLANRTGFPSHGAVFHHRKLHHSRRAGRRRRLRG